MVSLLLTLIFVAILIMFGIEVYFFFVKDRREKNLRPLPSPPLSSDEIVARETSKRQLSLAEMIVNQLDQAVVTLDPNGNVTSWNTLSERLTGFAPDEVLGKNYTEVLKFVNNEGEPTRTFIDLALKGTTQSIPKRTFLKTHAATLAVSGVTQPLHLGATTPGAILAFRDVTREFEEREATQAFIAAVAHDLRTPLTIIHGTTDLLLKRMY